MDRDVSRRAKELLDLHDLCRGLIVERLAPQVRGQGLDALERSRQLSLEPGVQLRVQLRALASLAEQQDCEWAPHTRTAQLAR